MARQLVLLLLFTLCLFVSQAKKVQQKDSKSPIENAKKVDDHLTEEKDLAEQKRILDEDEDEDDFDDDVEDMLRGPRPACSNRKCLRYYNGSWKDDCPAGTFGVNYCEKTSKWCCVRDRRKESCIAKGGSCTLNGVCTDNVDSDGCFGRKWHCCYP